MVPFFSDCSGKSGKSGKAVFRHFSQTARAKPEKVGKWYRSPHPLPRMASRKKYPFTAFSAFFPAPCKKCRVCSCVVVPQRQCLTCTQKLPQTHRPWLGYSYCHAAPSRLPRRSAVHRPKTAPTHHRRVAKFRADAPTAPRLLHQ